MKAGADPNAPDKDDKDDWALLHCAAQYTKSPAVLGKLLDSGVDPNARDKNGKTPWDFAKKQGAQGHRRHSAAEGGAGLMEIRSRSAAAPQLSGRSPATASVITRELCVSI